MPVPDSPRPPLIVVSLAAPEDAADPALQRRRNDRYVDAVERHGARVVRLTPRSTAAERDAAFAAMDGLLLTGGADIDPRRYGQAVRGAQDVDEARDELEAAAWAAAADRGVPVLGICRGLQAINVFSGGSLLQHVEGHAGPAWGSGPAATHPLRLVEGTRLASLLGRAGSSRSTPTTTRASSRPTSRRACGPPPGPTARPGRSSKASRQRATAASSSASSATPSARNRRRASSSGCSPRSLRRRLRTDELPRPASGRGGGGHGLLDRRVEPFAGWLAGERRHGMRATLLFPAELEARRREDDRRVGVDVADVLDQRP